MLTAVTFIVIIGILIFVHELGHFLSARASGMIVDEFAFGFPPRLWSVKRGATRFVLNALPIGGYVKILGEGGETKRAGSFLSKPWVVRLFVVVAGVVANFILAVALFTLGFTIGMTPPVSDPATLGGVQDPVVMIANVQDDSAAMQAGLKEGDRLLGSVAGEEDVAFRRAEDVSTFTRQHAGETLNMDVLELQSGETVRKIVTLAQGETPLGVSLVETAIVRLPLGQAIIQGFRETWRATGVIIDFLGYFVANLFRGTLAAEVTGPVGIYQFTGQALSLGAGFVIQLVAILSINLGLINILPFPALDGGRALFIALEGITKRRIVGERAENVIHMIGFFILILLLIAVTWRDLVVLFTS